MKDDRENQAELSDKGVADPCAQYAVASEDGIVVPTSPSDAPLFHSDRMETIGLIASGVAHDLNNLLAPIISYAQLALDDLSPDDIVYQDIIEISDAARKANSLTKQLLSFSRRQEPAQMVVNLNDSIAGMKKMLRRILRENISIEYHLDIAIDGIKADLSQMDQIVLNLAVNSQDAMPEGGRLVIETANVDLDERFCDRFPAAKSGPYVLLTVKDTGTGMDEGTRSRIFDSFFTTKGDLRGTGLGLATVKSIVERSGGFIQVISDIGRGTSFKIFLPRLPGSLPGRSPGMVTTPPRGNGERILITEDDDGIRRLAARILEKHGYDVIEASDADETIQAVTGLRRPVDLFLLDMVLPGMNGLELYKKLNTLRPGTEAIFMSGYDRHNLRAQGIEIPTAGFLAKPFSVLSLTTKVRDTLGRSMVVMS